MPRTTDLTTSQKLDVELAMEAARGLPAHVVVRFVNRAQRGIDYTGCGKRHIFESIVANGLDAVHDNSLIGRPDETWTVRKAWWNQLLDDLRKEPRPPTRKQRKEADQREAAREEAERKKEASGWTVKKAERALYRLDDDINKLNKRRDALKQERDKMLRILHTLDPIWEFR